MAQMTLSEKYRFLTYDAGWAANRIALSLAAEQYSEPTHHAWRFSHHPAVMKQRLRSIFCAYRAENREAMGLK